MADVALVELGLMPWDFDRLTTREVRLLLEGQQKRDRRIWRKLAQLAAWLMSPYTKKPVRARDLLGLPDED